MDQGGDPDPSTRRTRVQTLIRTQFQAPDLHPQPTVQTTAKTMTMSVLRLLRPKLVLTIFRQQQGPMAARRSGSRMHLMMERHH